MESSTRSQTLKKLYSQGWKPRPNGWKHSPETRKKMSALQFARYGNTSCVKVQKKRDKWKADVFKRDGYKCRNCPCTDVHLLEAHHVRPRIIYPELKDSVENGITLCHECHQRTDTYGPKVLKLLVDFYRKHHPL